MLTFLSSKDPEYQGLGWLLFHTVAWRPKPSGFDGDYPFPNRTAYATAELGQPLTTKDLAAFFRPQWSPRKARLVWQRMAARGWVEKRDGKLYLRGDCPVKFAVVSEDASAASPSESPTVDPVAAYLARLAPYQQAEVAKLPRVQQEALVTNLERFDERRKTVEADAIMAARDQLEPVRHKIFKAFRITCKVGPKLQKARATCTVQLKLFGELELDLPVNGKSKAAASPAEIGRRIVETNSAALNPNTQENVRPGGNTSGKAPLSRAADTTLTAPNPTGGKTPTQPESAARGAVDPLMGRDSGDVVPVGQHRTGESAPPEEQPVSQPRSAQARDQAASDFNDTLSRRFHDVGAKVPVRKQSDPIFRQLGPRVAEFLSWASPIELKSRNVRNGGILPYLYEEFEKISSLGPPDKEECIERIGIEDAAEIKRLQKMVRNVEERKRWA
jgi:hypothetical protein